VAPAAEKESTVKRIALIVAALCTPLAAAAPAAPPGATTKAVPAGLPHLRIDMKKRTVEMDCRVALTEGSLELLVCMPQTKEHETILVTDAKPSHLHAALLALGLRPGKPAHWAKTATGRRMLMPPAGAELEISLKYKGDAGQVVTVAAQDWLSREADDELPSFNWVFIGSVMLGDGQYWADREGDIISVANFGSSVIDVPFLSTATNEGLAFSANSDEIPAEGSAVTLVIHPAEGAERAAVARASFAIDRFGRYRLDGLAITPEKIEAWAEQYRSRHARPYIVVNAAPRAQVFDVERLKQILSDARIEDVQVWMHRMAGEILPRSPQQLAEVLKQWEQRFAKAEELLFEPGQEAEVILRQITHRRKELAALAELWSAYEKRLGTALQAYRVTTRPAKPDGAE